MAGGQISGAGVSTIFPALCSSRVTNVFTFSQAAPSVNGSMCLHDVMTGYSWTTFSIIIIIIIIIINNERVLQSSLVRPIERIAPALWAILGEWCCLAGL
jgi:hypothetical protein